MCVTLILPLHLLHFFTYPCVRTQSKGVVCGSSLVWAAGDPACNGETIGEKIGEKTLLASTRDRSALILHIEECC